jgi:uncharacterized protein (TIGR03067 family)
MKWQVILALAVSWVIGCGSARAADEAKEELKKLQGEWPVVAREVLGQNVLSPASKDPKIVLDGDKLTFKMNGWEGTCGVKLDPSASPKAIDFTDLEGPHKGKVTPAIYHLEDGELWICFGPMNGARPDDYVTRDRTDRILLKCKRPKPPDEATAKEMKKLAGTWLAVSVEVGGVPYPEQSVKKLKYTISAEKIVVNWGGEAPATYQLDVKADPKAIDMVGMSGGVPGAKSKGIYKLDGDELTICFDDASAGRPTEFETKPKTRRTLYKFKREKP